MTRTDDGDDVQVTFAGAFHHERTLPEPRGVDAWETAVIAAIRDAAGAGASGSGPITVHGDCSHCPSVVLADLGPTMTTDGYLHEVLPVELVGNDLDGMGLHLMLRVLPDGSPSWLEAYREDGAPFMSQPPVSVLAVVHLWAH